MLRVSLAVLLHVWRSTTTQWFTGKTVHCKAASSLLLVGPVNQLDRVVRKRSLETELLQAATCGCLVSWHGSSIVQQQHAVHSIQGMCRSCYARSVVGDVRGLCRSAAFTC
jgi:hypothetical protein